MKSSDHTLTKWPCFHNHPCLAPSCLTIERGTLAGDVTSIGRENDGVLQKVVCVGSSLKNVEL
jgi:hypothetical protein